MIVDEGGPIGPLETAAVLAVLARFEEEQEVLRSIAPEPLRQSRWVMAGRPRPVATPSVARQSPRERSWGPAGADQDDTVPPGATPSGDG
ncbi:MAG: hypothetical protein WD184_03980 [Acidimicrobiia bacterium]